MTSDDATVAKFFEIIEDQDGVKLVIAQNAAIDFEKYVLDISWRRMLWQKPVKISNYL